jgi:hypothetical protein
MGLLGFVRRFDRERRFVEHPIGIREITSLTLTTPVPLRSTASQSMVESRIPSSQAGPITLLEIEFDGNGRKEMVAGRICQSSFTFGSRRGLRPQTASSEIAEHHRHSEVNIYDRITSCLPTIHPEHEPMAPR